MTPRSAGSTPRRLAAVGGIAVFAVAISLHLGLRAYWCVSGTTPPPTFEPRAYNNVLGDLEPRRTLVASEIPDLPYTVRTNSQGFRALKPLKSVRAGNTLRVLCLGDSFTYGVGVDDPQTYPALLQLYLQNRFPDRRVEVINAGVPFYDIFDELSYYRDKGRQLAPDLVVLQFYSNDLEAMASAFFRQDLLVRQGGVFNAFEQATGAEAVERSFNNWLKNAFPRLEQLRHAPPAFAGPPPASTGPFRAYHFKASPQEKQLLADKASVLNVKNVSGLSRFWTNYRKALLVLRDEVVRDGAAFLCILAPDVLQMREDYNSPAAALVPFCQENGIPLIDMARQLRAASNDNPDRAFLVPRNDHPNAVGNTLMAKAVAEALSLESGQPRPRVRVAPAQSPFAYADPVPLLLQFGPHGVAPTANGPVSLTTVACDNLHYSRLEMGDGNRIDSLSTDLAHGPSGQLVLRLDAAVPLEQVSVTLFRRLFAPVSGFVQVSWSRDGLAYTQLLFASDKDATGPDGFENGRLMELDLRDNPARRLYLRLLLRDEAAVFIESKEPPWRRFEIVSYPAAGAGPGGAQATTLEATNRPGWPADPAPPPD